MSKFKGMIKSSKTKRAERERFYRTTIIGGILVLIAFFTVSAARAEEVNDAETIAAICSATTGMVGTLTEGPAGVVIVEEAKWWREFLEGWSEVSTAEAMEIIELYLKKLQNNYNAGIISWDEVVDLSMQCSAMKLEFIQRIEEEEA